MKKLIAMLNTFALLSSTVTSVVSCAEDNVKSKKTDKNEKTDKKDNEEDDTDNDDKIEQSLEFIIGQIKKTLIIANIKANDTNTILDLTNEVKKRIEKIIQDKPVSFELKIKEENESKLEEKSYQFNIDLKHIAQNNEEDSLSESFSIVVKKVEVDLEKQQMMKQLEQLDQEFKVKLLKKVFIADGINTYKSEKEKIKTDLINLALNKNAVLQIEFINSIFKDDNELIYKSENPFEVKIDLIAKENNQFFLSKVYKVSTVEGLTKEYLEDKKNKDLEYDAIREIIKNMFDNEAFTDNIANLINIKANSEHNVKDVITALNSLDNANVFGEKQDINKYKFHYATNLDLNDKLVTDKNLTIVVYAFDEEENQPFFNTEFDLNILGEDDLEQYERIAEKIKKYMNNKELDLSAFKELDADGKIQWQQTLSKIVKSDKIYDYFNFQPLGSDFKFRIC